ncbi:MAG: pyruvate, phosphate dikinase [Curvibacter sp.]|nr:pyruvate, phosphate dikinase [Curvibacter sp.]
MIAPDRSVFLIGCPDGAGPSLAEATPQALGFKAYNLWRMAGLGLRVPPAFVLGTAWCTDAESRRAACEPQAWQAGLQALEQACGLRLGDVRRPLLVSVRSGAPVSMPGMMETLLNIGLCEATVPGLLRQTGRPRLVWDAYRRLIATYGEVVAGLEAAVFEEDRARLGADRDERDLDFAELRSLCRSHLRRFAEEAGRPFPQDPVSQLGEAIAAVLASWQSDRAVEYRRLHALPDSLGTAVTVQRMVFGNAGARSGSGVGFTRDPVSGEPRPWVDFLFNAQGEDVVSGRRSAHGHDELAARLPDCWNELETATRSLEHALGDMQDFEFTVEEGRLYLLQTRSGKRSAQAAARIALDLHDEGLIDTATARQRTADLDEQALGQRRVCADDGQTLQPLAHAASAGPGVACGLIALDEAAALALRSRGEPVVLVRSDAETSDLAALEQAEGLLTCHGARTSHAAVIARQLGKVCLVGCAGLEIDLAARCLRLGGQLMREGEAISLDGNEGDIYAGLVRTRIEQPRELWARLQRLRGEPPGSALPSGPCP